MRAGATLAAIGWCLALALAATGCEEDGGGLIGDSCWEDGDCVSGLCSELTCVDPAADEDGDGLLNGLEAELGTDPRNRDSDADGADDPSEVDDPAAPGDEDGDGKIDAVESLIADADADCRVDQRDAQDEKADDDQPQLVAAACPDLGVCRSSAARRVRCPDGMPECVLAAVAGWEADELACDGLDNDCDGTVDEPARCGPGGPDAFGGAGDVRSDVVRRDSGVPAPLDVPLPIRDVPVPIPDVASGSDAAEDCGSAPGRFLCPCTTNLDCLSGFCVVLEGSLRVCTRTCVDDCPAEWVCTAADGAPDVVFICVPEASVPVP